MAPPKSRDLTADRRFGEVVDQLASGYKTIGQMVYGVLREAILSGAFAPGEGRRSKNPGRFGIVRQVLAYNYKAC